MQNNTQCSRFAMKFNYNAMLTISIEMRALNLTTHDNGEESANHNRMMDMCRFVISHRHSSLFFSIYLLAYAVRSYIALICFLFSCAGGYALNRFLKKKFAYNCVSFRRNGVEHCRQMLFE